MSETPEATRDGRRLLAMCLDLLIITGISSTPAATLGDGLTSLRSGRDARIAARRLAIGIRNTKPGYAEELTEDRGRGRAVQD